MFCFPNPESGRDHLRFIPRMLTKNEERIVWNPRHRKRGAGDHVTHGAGVIEVPEINSRPLQDGDHEHAASDDHGGGTQGEASFQIEQFEESIHARVFGMKPFNDGEGFGEDGKKNGLVSAKQKEA